MLNQTRRLNKDEFTLRVENEESISTKTVGEARLVFGDKFLLLDNIFYILNIRKNLILVFELHK